MLPRSQDSEARKRLHPGAGLDAGPNPFRWLRPLRLASYLTLLDCIWAVQALGSVPSHRGSNVTMVSLVVWVVLHLPAVVLSGGPLYAAGALKGPVTGLPVWSLVLLGALGLLQTFALVYGLSALAWRRSAR
ncbi:MAG TPA: hypothetical protein VK786_03465 [bacterium]|jgi:hypothetical protein|nr:hypothetical protein [bacterium]